MENQTSQLPNKIGPTSESTETSEWSSHSTLDTTNRSSLTISSTKMTTFISSSRESSNAWTWTQTTIKSSEETSLPRYNMNSMSSLSISPSESTESNEPSFFTTSDKTENSVMSSSTEITTTYSSIPVTRETWTETTLNSSLETTESIIMNTISISTSPESGSLSYATSDSKDENSSVFSITEMTTIINSSSKWTETTTTPTEEYDLPPSTSDSMPSSSSLSLLITSESTESSDPYLTSENTEINSFKFSSTEMTNNSSLSEYTK